MWMLYSGVAAKFLKRSDIYRDFSWARCAAAPSRCGRKANWSDGMERVGGRRGSEASSSSTPIMLYDTVCGLPIHSNVPNHTVAGTRDTVSDTVQGICCEHRTTSP